mmetsp:Transcript_119544/g.234984  ORF Transcript_119544/g.234984 Transcript_119544/m.234984 type:complete len:242 (+) Transcript_119544:954-1679(+)
MQVVLSMVRVEVQHFTAPDEPPRIQAGPIRLHAFALLHSEAELGEALAIERALAHAALFGRYRDVTENLALLDPVAVAPQGGGEAAMAVDGPPLGRRGADAAQGRAERQVALVVLATPDTSATHCPGVAAENDRANGILDHAISELDDGQEGHGGEPRRRPRQGAAQRLDDRHREAIRIREGGAGCRGTPMLARRAGQGAQRQSRGGADGPVNQGPQQQLPAFFQQLQVRIWEHVGKEQAR